MREMQKTKVGMQGARWECGWGNQRENARNLSQGRNLSIVVEMT